MKQEKVEFGWKPPARDQVKSEKYNLYKYAAPGITFVDSCQKIPKIQKITPQIS